MSITKRAGPWLLSGADNLLACVTLTTGHTASGLRDGAQVVADDAESRCDLQRESWTRLAISRPRCRLGDAFHDSALSCPMLQDTYVQLRRSESHTLSCREFFISTIRLFENLRNVNCKPRQIVGNNISTNSWPVQSVWQGLRSAGCSAELQTWTVLYTMPTTCE